MRGEYYGRTAHLAMARQYRQDEEARLRTVFGGKTVCLIAQGESAGRVKRGKFIDDEHDLVVRMNHFEIKGFEDYVGSRIDVHAFTNHSGLHSPDCRRARWFYFADGFLLKQHDDPIYSEINTLFWSRPPGVWQERLGDKWPTTGFRILLEALDAGARAVTLIGYDFYQNSCYYFDPLVTGKEPASRGFWDWHPDCEHSPALEKEIVEEMARTDSRVTKL